jgi:hypothetical protein
LYCSVKEKVAANKRVKLNKDSGPSQGTNKYTYVEKNLFLNNTYIIYIVKLTM